MQAAIYCRISEDRSGEALGVARQEKLCRELADRLGWDVADVYVDNDRSAFNGRPRPAYAAMLEAARAGVVDGILVLDTDRLTRHPRELEDVIDLADEHRIALANVSGRIDLGTSEGRLLARITGAVARQESEHKSERQRRKMTELAEAGKPSGGPRPFGLHQRHRQRDEDGRPVKDGAMLPCCGDEDACKPGTIREDEAAAIREAARAVLDEDRSWRQVARGWNEAGLLTPRGNEWRAGSARRTLTSPHLAALRQHRGEVVGKAEWEPVLDVRTHERLAALVRRGRPTTPTRRLLSGLLVCGREGCGAGLVHGTTSAARRIYYCKRAPGEPSRCGRLSVSAEPAEQAVREMILHRLSGPGLAAALDAHGGAEQAEVLAELDDVRARLTDAAKMYGKREISKPEFEAMRAPLLAAQREAGDRLEVASVDTSPLADLADVAELEARWDDPDEPDTWRRAVLDLLLERVEVRVVGARKQRFDPARLVPHWRA